MNDLFGIWIVVAVGGAFGSFCVGVFNVQDKVSSQKEFDLGDITYRCSKTYEPNAGSK